MWSIPGGSFRDKGGRGLGRLERQKFSLPSLILSSARQRTPFLPSTVYVFATAGNAASSVHCLTALASAV